MTATEKKKPETPFDFQALAEGWASAKMRDIADIVGGGTPRTSDESSFCGDGHAWITPADLSGFNQIYITRGKRSLSDKGLKSCSARIMPKGTVLMSSRAPIGYVAIAANPICTNQGFKSFVCHPDIIPEYVYFWIRFMKPQLETLGSGSTFLEISGSRAREIPILIAPTAEQKRIVAKVEELLVRVSAAKERLARVKEILKRFRQSVLAAACSGRLTEDCKAEKTRDESSANNTVARSQAKLSTAKADNVSIPELPESWDWTALKAICEYQGGFAFKSKKFLNEGKNQVLRIGNVRPGYIDFDIAPVYIDDEYAAAKKGFQVMENDILVSMTGTKYKGDYGYAGIVPKTDKGAFLNQRVGRLRAGPAIQPKFLLYWLQTKTFRDFFFQNETGNVNQGNVGAEALRQTPAPVPPMTEQMEIVRRAEALFNMADGIEMRVAGVGQRAEKLTKAILAKAFRAELVPTEAELARREGRLYEPARVLLERVRKARGEARPRAKKKKQKRVKQMGKA